MGGCEGCVCPWVCAGRVPPSTDDDFFLEAMIASESEVIMKMTVAHVVALVRTVAAPRGPKAVWLPMPPKAAAISALLPLCNSTTMIRKKQTTMCTIVRRITMP